MTKPTNIIYLYTTEENRKKGFYKIGQTKNSDLSRIKAQQTSNSEPIIIVGVFETTLTDYQIRDVLYKMGYIKNISGGKEWVGGFKNDDEPIIQINKILSKSINDTRQEYKSRHYQIEFKNQFLKKYKEEKNADYKKIDFIWELAPRFGKTVFSLDVCKELYGSGYKICFMLTYVLTATSSIQKEFYKYKDFSDSMVLIDLYDENFLNKIKENYGKKLIILTISLHATDFESKLEFAQSIPEQEKMAIIDEADFGAHRNNSQEKIKHLNCSLSIYMSGTGIEKVSHPLLNTRDNIFRCSYIDLMMYKKGKHPFQDDLSTEDLEKSKKSVNQLVDPIFLCLELVKSKIIEKFNEIDPKYRTDWSKLLSDVKKSTGIIVDLVQSLFGVYNGSIEYLVNLNTNSISPKDVTMIFANTQNKIQQKELKKVIQHALGPNYIVEILNSDETSNKEAEEMAHMIINRAKREHKKVVFISKDMGSRSFSVSEIDTVMLFFDRGSVSSVAQKISRALTPGKTFDGEVKESSTIISLSLDPNRDDINVIDEYLIHEAEKVDSKNLKESLLRVCNSVNIFRNSDGELVPIMTDEYTDKLLASTSLIRIGSASVKPDFVIRNKDLMNDLIGVTLDITKNKENLDSIDSSIIIRTLDKKKKVKTNEEEKEEDQLKKIKEILSNIVENAVEISEINNCESDDIVEVLDVIEKKGYCDEVISEVGVSCQVVKKLISCNAIPVKLLNTIITYYNKVENSNYSAVIHNEQLLKWKSNPSTGEVPTPAILVNEILDKIPDEVWKNPKSTFLDPCCGKGPFLIEITRRLVYIYGYTEEDAKSRVYGFDIMIKCVNHLNRRGFHNVLHKNFLNEEIKMQFDVVVGNPPYQIKVGPRKTEPIWNKFVRKIISITKIDGYVSLIHPSGWRNSEGNFKDIQNIYKQKDLRFLKMYNDTQGMKMFGASINFDWFLLKNTISENTLTEIYSYDGTNNKKDISKMDFIPNGKFEQIFNLLAKDGEQKVEVLYSRSNYGTDKKHMSKVQNEEFQYPCVCNVAKDETVTLMYSNTNEKGHFGIPKLICGGASSGTNFFIDDEGLYGITQFSFGIVENIENLESLKMSLKSKKFQEIIKSIPNNSQSLNYKIISLFRKDFWREFIDE